ncbi:PD-(D/E)XK nuclease family protein, partial [Streptomyces cirratus]
MPKPPQPAARQGTRFHAWVESRFDELPPLLDVLDPATELPAPPPTRTSPTRPTSPPSRPPSSAGEFADRTRTGWRPRSSSPSPGRVVRGRIDAVYKKPDGSYEIVDWKTGRTTEADPLQLAVYRLAWAEATQTPLDRVLRVPARPQRSR